MKEKQMLQYTAKGLLWFAIGAPVFRAAIKAKKDVPAAQMKSIEKQAAQVTKDLIKALEIRKQGICVINGQLEFIELIETFPKK